MKLGQTICPNDTSIEFETCHAGSKTRSLGQRNEKPCKHSRSHISCPIFMLPVLCQNVCLNDMLVEFKSGSGPLKNMDQVKAWKPCLSLTTEHAALIFDMWQCFFYGNFGADIRPHSPPKRVYIFPLFCKKNPLQKFKERSVSMIFISLMCQYLLIKKSNLVHFLLIIFFQICHFIDLKNSNHSKWLGKLSMRLCMKAELSETDVKKIIDIFKKKDRDIQLWILHSYMHTCVFS